MTRACVLCGNADFTQPRGFYRHAGYTYEQGHDTATHCTVGPLHFDCADLWRDAQLRKRMPSGTEQSRVRDGERDTLRREPKTVTSKARRGMK